MACSLSAPTWMHASQQFASKQLYFAYGCPHLRAPWPHSPPQWSIHPNLKLESICGRQSTHPRRIEAAASSSSSNDTSGPGGSDPSAAREAVDRKLIRDNVEAAAKTLDSMLTEIMQELFVDQASTYIMSDYQDQGPSITEGEAIRNAVVQRIEFLDANFLAALNAYIEVAEARKDSQLLQLLVMLRDELLHQVALRLPSAARVLDAALREPDKDQRLAVLRKALAGGEGELPGASHEDLMTTTTQFIDDMEDQEIIADRRLLARLCILREEVRWLDLEASFNAAAPKNGTAQQQQGTPFLRSNVPQRVAAFLKELVSVNDPSVRVALLQRTFSEDWEGAAPRQKPQTLERQDQPDYVRPGRFLNTLQSMIQQLELDREKNSRVLQRLGDIHIDAVAVLDKLQRGAFEGPGF